MSIIYFFRKLAASFISLILLIGYSEPETRLPAEKVPENCSLNFTVISDAHIESNNYTTIDTFANVLYDIENNTASNTLVFLGDNTMNGQNIEKLVFYGMLKKIIPDKTVYTALGNHDTGNGIDDYDHRFGTFFSYYNGFYDDSIETPYYYKEVSGCYFIFLGSESDAINYAKISAEQLDWLENLLKTCTLSGKPTFIFNHHPYFAVEDYSAELQRIITEYKNVFYISGHTHTEYFTYYDLDEDSHYINLPKVTELREDGNDNDFGMGIQVYVFDDSVNIKTRRYYDSEWGKYDLTYELK